MNLLDTIWAKFDVGSKEVNTLILVERAVNEGRLDNTTLALSSLEQALSEASTSHSHGQSSRASTILSLDDLVATELDAVDKSVELLAEDIAVARLGNKRNDCDAGVATNDSNFLIGWVGTLDLGDETGGTHDIEAGNTEESLWIVDAPALENLSDDGDRGVDLMVLLVS